MTNDEWQTIAERYRSPLSTVPAIVARDDIKTMIEHISGVHEMVNGLRDELQGAKMTLMAITKKTGRVDVPFRDIESLHPKDELLVSDEQTPNGLNIKRFQYEPHKPFAPLTLVK